MKRRKGLFLLAVFFTALMLLGGEKTEATPIVTGVTISSPDSGALRGIDSIFVATAKVIEVPAGTNLSVIMYLVTNNGAAGDTVVTDGTVGASVAFSGATSPLSYQIKRRVGFPKDGSSEANTVNQIASAAETRGVVAVLQSRGSTGSKHISASALTAAAPVAGDGDSVTVTTSGDTTVFTWYGKVDATVGVASGVRVAALAAKDATSGALTDISSIATSPATKRFGVDGDRPVQPNNFKFTSALIDVGSSIGAGDNSKDYGNFTTTQLGADSDSDGIVDGTTGAGGQPLNNIFKVNPGHALVGGFASTASATRTVLGIGDSLRLWVDLGDVTIPVVFGDSLNAVVNFLSKQITMDKTSRLSSVLRKTYIVTEGDFGNVTDPGSGSPAHEIGVYLIDKAGNRSSTSKDAAAVGVTAGATFLVDAKKPTIDGVTGADGSDTLLPASNDTISDGSINSNYAIPYAADINDIRYKLAEALDSLFINFKNASTDLTLRIPNVTSGNPTIATSGTAPLAAGQTRKVDFTMVGNPGEGAASSTATDTVFIADADNANRIGRARNPNAGVAITDTLLTTGLYTLNVSGRDLGGNLGPVLSRTNTYVDVDDITLLRLFPTKASGLDTIDETTAQLVFKLSEPADSVLISYASLSGPDYDSNQRVRTRRLSGSSLTNTAAENTYLVDSLKSGTKYRLTVLARDLAGNYTRTKPDTFIYDTAFVVPVIAKFAITADTARTGYGTPIVAGDTITVTLIAQTSKSTDAVTYKKSAILKVAGSGGTGKGVAMVSGTGATDLGNGRISLNADDWVTGRRSVIIKDTTSIDTLSLSIVDSTNAASIYSGKLDSVISILPNKYDHIWASAPDTVTEGTPFWVSLKLVDVYGNTRTKDNRYVVVRANKLGVDAPFEAAGVYLEKGVGGFWATSQSFTGNDLVFGVRDVIAKTTALPGSSSTEVGDNYIHGKTDSILVLASGASAGGELAAPGEPVAQDYMGADGQGDQGGFVLLNFAPSADHETLTAYRIWREIVVDYDVDDTGALVELAEPTSKYIPWGKVDAVPGIEGAMHVVVATLDGVATNWALSAERGRETTAPKQSFISAAVSPMERMAQNLKNKQMVKTPVFATLTPEALAFIQKGIAPRMNATLPLVVQSAKVYTKQPVRAIDNIAPEAVTALRAIDTPNDAGGSVTVTWVKSESDAPVSRMIPGAVGPVASDVIAGVKGYNIYRKSGRGDYTLVGKTGPGETSFADGTVFNGERYTYKVVAYDDDNTAPASVERTTMAIRNRVFDRTGAVVLGLFGVDNKVGFDDFFVLADRFGLTAGDEGFDSAFDLRPDNRIDFDDFFVFADNFGKGVEGSAKTVPMLAGLNTDARLDLNAGSTLPRIGEEMAVAVDLANFVEVKGYGFSVNYDPSVLEFVRVATDNSLLLGEGKLAQPQVANNADGTVAVAAYGQTATEGKLGVNLIFRTKAEIENSYIDITEAQLQDGSYGLNVATLGQPVQVQTRPEIYSLADNYPNPFNPETTLKYQLPEAANVKLDVYNVVGQVVRTLVADHQNAGRYVVQWDATNDNGQPLSSGIYFYHIQAGDFQKTKKMLLLK